VELHYEYLLNWIARAVQCPELRAEVAVAIRGKKGTGKGMFCRIFGRIFGKHYLQLDKASHFTGSFNEHLRDVLVANADEAFFAGAKADEGTLKSLVTEETILINGKFRPAYSWPNRLKLIITTNHDWVVPASEDERRYFVLSATSDKKRNREYFNALAAEIAGAGAAAFLHELLKRDISDFDIRDEPHTAALEDQIAESFTGMTAWWFDVLNRGYVFESKFGTQGLGGWKSEVAFQLLGASYDQWKVKQRNRAGGGDSVRGLGVFFKNTLGCFHQRMPENSTIGEKMVKGEGEAILHSGRSWGYDVEKLETARLRFERVFNIEPDWNPTDDNDDDDY
jgi:hypothetical protein